MKKNDFFSSNSYLFLPTKKNPKVALVVDDLDLIDNAFKLYNPFSKKAKILKSVSQFIFKKFNIISQIVYKVNKEEKSLFIKYLEEKLNTSLVASLYFATINDKVVIQLQTKDAKIIGYLKYPLNNVGLKHIENEKKAIDILSKKNIVKKYLFFNVYQDTPFLLLDVLEGNIGIVSKKHVKSILNLFKRKTTYILKEHPRIISLKNDFEEKGISMYLTLIDELCSSSDIKYELVYEHGDFTPWNIVKIDNSYIPFDFEYFVEDGLEFFDFIKYYYQIGRLLKKLEAEDLIKFVEEQINLEEFKILFKLFLLKEIYQKIKLTESINFEENLLNILETK